MKKWIWLWLISPLSVLAQHSFTLSDSLRGSLLPEKSCYDVTHYDLKLALAFGKGESADLLNQLSGEVVFTVKNTADYTKLRFDLFNRFEVDSIRWQGQMLNFSWEHNTVLVEFPGQQLNGHTNQFTVYYRGEALVARNAPWDGGFSFSKDSQGKPWVGVSCEGLGASSWWPNKDHLSDEPDSMRMTFTLPDTGLMVVSNGKLTDRYTKDKKETFVWEVKNPINNYNVTLNIADYVLTHEYYIDANGIERPLKFYVLRENIDKAGALLEQAVMMMACFEEKLGPYPFWEDGYALVETPYWGMEHQSAIAYGNRFRNNNFGFDFILIHESGHEWFGNSISVNDHAAMWIHESFCTYSETIYLECIKGKDIANRYINTQRNRILNKQPMLGPMGVNYLGGDVDNYFKGAWIIHSLRNSLANDSLFYALIKQFNIDFFKKTVQSNEVVNWWVQHTDTAYAGFWKHYLQQAHLPVLEYSLKGKGKKRQLYYRYQATAADFYMPINLPFLNNTPISPRTEWQKITFDYPIGEDPWLPWSNYLLKVKNVKKVPK